MKFEVLAILKEGGREKFPPFKRGGGGVAESLGPAVFPFCSPPSP